MGAHSIREGGGLKAKNKAGENHAFGLTCVPAWDKKGVSRVKGIISTPPFVVLSGQTVPSQTV